MVRYAAVQGHLGGNYISEINSDGDIEFIEEVCKFCSDYDYVLGVYNTRIEAENHLY